MEGEPWVVCKVVEEGILGDCEDIGILVSQRKWMEGGCH